MSSAVDEFKSLVEGRDASQDHAKKGATLATNSTALHKRSRVCSEGSNKDGTNRCCEFEVRLTTGTSNTPCADKLEETKRVERERHEAHKEILAHEKQMQREKEREDLHEAKMKRMMHGHGKRREKELKELHEKEVRKQHDHQE